ncbi:hypothetical protein M9458_005377, partial [Cirrhinus mrigala]
TDHEKQVTESHPQKVETEKEEAKTRRPENNIIRWIPSSIKYRSKIEELRNDSPRKKVGNLIFSRSNKYIIGSGGSGKVYLGLKEDGTEVAPKHPFGDIKDREENIKKGQHSLEDLQDIVVEDLIEWMINKEPAERLTIDEVLRHPYFWDDD